MESRESYEYIHKQNAKERKARNKKRKQESKIGIYILQTVLTWSFVIEQAVLVGYQRCSLEM